MIIWLIGSFIYFMIELGIMGDSIVYPSTGNSYDFKASAIAIPIIGISLGLVLGLIEETIFKKILRKWPFILKFLLKTGLYLFIIVITFFISTIVLNSRVLDAPLSDPIVIATVSNFMGNLVFISLILYLGVFIGFSLFFSDMVDHIGINAIVTFFTGKYSKSVIEDRIFMFLDMRSSTAIAEKLGHEKYYKLLNSYYEDMTDPIISTAGEIYQYIGDEIVVSWRYNSGIKDNNCIESFFLIKKRLMSKSNYYLDHFGMVPEFKAGLHYGTVTTGVVGLVKKEILFTGDVLNTTARIQQLCNELKVSILISKELKDELNLDTSFKAIEKGAFELRGRNQSVKLFELIKN